jgi:hypothetical protein
MDPAAPSEAALLPRGLAWPALAAGVLILASFLLTAPRAPVPWKDETYDASAVLSLVQGGSGVPTVLQPGTWAPFPRVYGPAYFSVATAVARRIGVTPTAIRLPCLLGAILIAVAAGWLALAVTGSAVWAAVSFAVLAAAPDLALVAVNGRVDSLAIAGALIGEAALVDASRRRSGAASASLAAIAGTAWALSLLASPRVLPWFGAFALVAPGLLWLPKATRARVLASVAIAAGIAAGAYVIWTRSIGSGPIARLLFLRQSTEGDWFDVVVPGGHRALGLYLRPGVTCVSALLMAALTIACRPMRDEAGGFARVAFWGAAVTVAYWLLTGNNILYHGAYFTLPLLATSLALAPAARLRRTVLLAWAAVATLFAAIALGKTIEIAQSWTASDPRPLQAFLEREVPAGSIVFGPDADYFYAVEAARSSFRTVLRVPFPAPGFGQATVPNAFAGTEGARRFLLWHAGDAIPEDVPCRLSKPLATFHPVRRTGALARFVSLYAREHGFVDTSLFAVPPGCGKTSSGGAQAERASER